MEWNLISPVRPDSSNSKRIEIPKSIDLGTIEIAIHQVLSESSISVVIPLLPSLNLHRKAPR